MALGDKYFLLIFESETEARKHIKKFRKKNDCEEIVEAGDDFKYGTKWVVIVKVIEEGKPCIRKMLYVYENRSKIFDISFKPSTKELLQRTQADK